MNKPDQSSTCSVSTDTSPPPDLSLAAPAGTLAISADLPCSRCAYNLRGLTPDLRCPECGTPIAQSLYGNWLRLADLDWLKKLKLGASLKLWGLVLGFLLSFLIGIAGGMLGAVTAAAGIFPMLVTVAGLLGGLLALIATFLITAPEPTIGKAEDPMTLRKVIRFCAMAGLAGGVLNNAPGAGALRTAMAIAGAALSLISVVATFGEFVYLRRFARRIPNLKLAKQTTVVMWGFGVTGALTAIGALVVVTLSTAGIGPFGPGGPMAGTAAGTGAAPPGSATTGSGSATPMLAIGAGVIACFVGVAFLVFFVMYVGLLIRYYRAFKQAVAEADLISRGELPAFQVAPATPQQMAT